MSKRALKVVNPGEDPTVETEAEATEPATDEGIAETEPTTSDVKPFAELKKRVRHAAVPKLETSDIDESEVDPASIPFGQTLLTKQGRVCSTAPAPKAK